MTVFARHSPTDGSLRVVFNGRLDPGYAVDQYLACVEAPKAGATVQYDFSNCTRAFPNVALPILCDYLTLRHNSVNCLFIPPKSPSLDKLFYQTGISHYFDPTNFDYPVSASDQHLAAVHITNAAEQHELVNRTVDLLLKATPLNKSVLSAFRWILNEISGNIFDHANSPIGGFVQLDVHKNNRLSLCVCDPGDGIAKSIKSAGRHGQIRDAREAVEHAIRRGITRDPESNQGNGLAGSLSLAKAFKGRFMVRSDEGVFLYEYGKSARPGAKRKLPLFGTLVDIQINMDVDVDNIGEVITGSKGTNYEPHDVIIDDYGTDDPHRLRLVMSKETFGFGNREAGRQMRQKAWNLLTNSNSRLSISWHEVPLISSSFADEFVGKLFIELGPIDFSSRIQMTGLDRDTKHIIDFAIKQRMSQSLGCSWS